MYGFFSIMSGPKTLTLVKYFTKVRVINYNVTSYYFLNFYKGIILYVSPIELDISQT